MLYRAALIDKSYQSIISNYLNNSNSNQDNLDKSLYEFLNSLPYLKANCDEINDKSKIRKKSISLCEFNLRKSTNIINSRTL
jgi:hypothetical protein